MTEKKGFFSFWYDGFQTALEKMDEKNRNILLNECGEACSSSYTRGIYIDEYNKSQSIHEFLERLKVRFPELQYEISQDNRSVIFTYTHCACDLVKNKYITSGFLCDCSKYSLLNNWEAVIGKGKVRVSLIHSILRGQDSCRFNIELP